MHKFRSTNAVVAICRAESSLRKNVVTSKRYEINRRKTNGNSFIRFTVSGLCVDCADFEEAYINFRGSKLMPFLIIEALVLWGVASQEMSLSAVVFDFVPYSLTYCALTKCKNRTLTFLTIPSSNRVN